MALLEGIAASIAGAVFAKLQSEIVTDGTFRRLFAGDEKKKAYEKALALNAGNAPTLFRLGVAHRRRFETGFRKPDDFQKAVDNWAAALDVDPNQYIWARRIQQFGPILSKPYPFYDWVARAQEEILARGEAPVKLRVPLTGSERLGRGQWKPPVANMSANPDPEDRILHDKKRLVGLTVVAVPAVGRSGGDVRLHLFPKDESHAMRRRKASGRVTRWMRLLRAHGLIRKVSGTRYYRVTEKGHHVMTTALKLRQMDVSRLAA